MITGLSVLRKDEKEPLVALEVEGGLTTSCTGQTFPIIQPGCKHISCSPKLSNFTAIAGPTLRVGIPRTPSGSSDPGSKRANPFTSLFIKKNWIFLLESYTPPHGMFLQGSLAFSQGMLFPGSIYLCF